MAKYEVVVDGRQYEVEIVRDDGQRAVLKVDGREYEVEATSISSVSVPAANPSLADVAPAPKRRSSAAAPPGAQPAAGSGGMQVRAPMPGLVLQVCVSVGQGVKSGDVLFRLEAMKMENDIESQAEGRVKEILVVKGDEVQEGQVLMVLEG